MVTAVEEILHNIPLYWHQVGVVWKMAHRARVRDGIWCQRAESWTCNTRGSAVSGGGRHAGAVWIRCAHAPQYQTAMAMLSSMRHLVREEVAPTLAEDWVHGAAADLKIQKYDNIRVSNPTILFKMETQIVKRGMRSE